MKHFRGSVSVLAVTALLAAALAGCSSGSDEPTETDGTVTVTYSSSTSNAPTTQTVTSSPSPGDGGTSRATGDGGTSRATGDGSAGDPSGSSSPSSTSSGPGASAPTSPPKDIGAYADTFVRAWGRGDRSVASTYASASAVSSLFGQRAVGGGGWQRQGLTHDGGSVEVRYSDGTDTLTVRLDAGDAASGTEHAVSSATLSADAPQTGDGLPTSLTDYADAFVRAWGKGESGAWTYTSDAVELTFGSTNPSGGPRWSRTSSGTTTVTYGNRDGGTLVLTLDLERVGSGSAGAITGASLS
ncbi:hypothetical protein [Janibacter indicus]|uniref:Lipoprotein n=1 Tax=Janibacter indicus TaxID=857417 RepID=A0A7L9IXX0_9MICO|nr:hypothetical protein [Janibacter indicus]QOK21984.1 hypothetical protein IGS73_12820 [Janibacter indicus]